MFTGRDAQPEQACNNYAVGAKDNTDIRVSRFHPQRLRMELEQHELRAQQLRQAIAFIEQKGVKDFLQNMENLRSLGLY